jgi:hypothetical protein
MAGRSIKGDALLYWFPLATISPVPVIEKHAV